MDFYEETLSRLEKKIELVKDKYGIRPILKEVEEWSINAFQDLWLEEKFEKYADIIGFPNALYRMLKRKTYTEKELFARLNEIETIYAFDPTYDGEDEYYFWSENEEWNTAFDEVHLTLRKKIFIPNFEEVKYNLVPLSRIDDFIRDRPNCFFIEEELNFKEVKDLLASKGVLVRMNSKERREHEYGFINKLIAYAEAIFSKESR